LARILHLISQLEQGGAQRQLSYILQHSRTHQHEVASLIATPKKNLFPFFRDIDKDVHFLSDRNDFYAPEIFPKLRKLIRDHKYSVIHCWLLQSVVQGFLAARCENAFCVSSLHSLRQHLKIDAHRAWEKFLIRKSLLNSDVVLPASSSIAVDFVDLGWVDPRRCRIVKNCVDDEYFAPSGASGKAVVSLGRLVPGKGFEEFEWIAEQLKQQFPTLSFLVAGGHKDTTSVVEYLGILEDVREVLGQACIYLSTSHFEGLSSALLEAQAMGVPVVARKIGPNAEAILDGVTGLLGDSRNDLLEACIKLIRDPKLHSEMSHNARMRVCEQFACKRQVSKIEEIYSELLQANHFSREIK
jgi:glycosyltransferase involved in cell wall biosynthesis